MDNADTKTERIKFLPAFNSYVYFRFINETTYKPQPCKSPTRIIGILILNQLDIISDPITVKTEKHRYEIEDKLKTLD